jgi:tetratricopeptide (TPR) repeat protein
MAAEGLVIQGDDLARNGTIDEALATYEEALLLDPTLELDAQAQASKMMVEGLIGEGRRLASAGDVDSALAAFEKAVALDPDLALEPVEDVAELAVPELIEQSEALARDGDIDEAITKLEEAMALQPQPYQEYHSAYNSLCWWGSLSGQAAQVTDICEQAVGLAPHDGAIRDSRGLNRALLGDIEGA